MEVRMDEQIKAALEQHQKSIDSAIQKYENELAVAGSASNEAKAAVAALSEKFESTVTELAQKMEGIKADASAPVIQTAGAEFVKSEAFAQLVAGNTQRARIEVKNTVTSGSTTVFPQQMPGVISGDFKPLTIRQLFRAIPVSTNMVNSLREASWTNDAVEVSQGSAKPESDITFEQYNVPITTVAHWIKVSNQLLADAPAIVSYIDSRLRDGLAQRIDAQLLNGDGTSPNLSGITDSGNFTAYTATSSDLLTDAIARAKYALWAKGYTPDAVIVNPADWATMELTREGAGSGMYLYGMPGVAAGVNPFGVRVVMSSNMTQGEFAIGAFDMACALYNRQGAVVEMGFVGNDFTNNLVTIRAEERLGLGVEKPSAILYGNITA
jgi:HK97 family phage major capsid protein